MIGEDLKNHVQSSGDMRTTTSNYFQNIEVQNKQNLNHLKKVALWENGPTKEFKKKMIDYYYDDLKNLKLLNEEKKEKS